MKYQKVMYNNKLYAVVDIHYKNTNLPMVLNWNDFKIFNKLDKTWKFNDSGVVSCYHMDNDLRKEIFAHEIVMALKTQNDTQMKHPIVHLNTIGLDNRRNNIMYDTREKTHKKNTRKKKRTIKLPTSSGINVNELPTYVWYLKENGSHGERFMVEINTTPKIKWKSTSSKKLSLRYKLEETKKYLRELKQSKPHLFENNCMNGEFTKKGKQLLKDFYKIIHKGGYTHIKPVVKEGITDKYLKENSVNIEKEEKKILKSFSQLDKKINSRRRRPITNLPKDSGILAKDLPKYSYFRPQYKNRGAYFVVENHPNQEKKIWQTTSSKKVSIQDKYNELMKYIEQL